MPIPAAVVLAVATTCVTWWVGTRRLDFLTPPARIPKSAHSQAEATAAAPPPDVAPANPSPPPNPPPPEPPPPDAGDLAAAPALDAYRQINDAAELKRLAEWLREKHAPQRELLAWERILDEPIDASPELREVACQNCERLRKLLPPWNVDSNATIPLILNVQASSSLGRSLERPMNEVAECINASSSGILALTPVFTPSRTRAAEPTRLLVAVSLGGAVSNSNSTGGADPNKRGGRGNSAGRPNTASAPEQKNTAVLTFAALDRSPEALRNSLFRTIGLLVHSQLSRRKDMRAPEPPPINADPAAHLNRQITRRCWYAVGTSLRASAPPVPPIQRNKLGEPPP